MCSELTHNIGELTHVFGELICICSVLTHIFGEPAHILSKQRHIFGELLPNSSELNKVIYCTQTRSFGRFLRENVGHPKHEIVKNIKPVRMKMQ